MVLEVNKTLGWMGGEQRRERKKFISIPSSVIKQNDILNQESYWHKLHVKRLLDP